MLLYDCWQLHMAVLCFIVIKLLRFDHYLFAVPLFEQVAAGARSMELSSADETYFVLILQEHMSLCYWGIKFSYI